MPATLKTRAIPDDVASILRASTLDGERLVLPATLERKQYEAVNKVIEGLGGKWSRQQKAHVFPQPAAVVLASALDEGAYVDDRLNGYFPTPAWLCRVMVEVAQISAFHSVLEPSAGEGALAEEIRTRDPHALTCVELDPRRAQVLRGKGFEVVEGDFLTALPLFGPGRFDRVVMNPPFNRREDVAHVWHAFNHLGRGGRLVAVMSAGVAFGEEKNTVALRKIIKQHGHVEPLEPGTFAEAGTEVNAVLVVLVKS
jgi:predicted RNA methylase